MHDFKWFLNKTHEVHGDEYIYESDSYVKTKEKMWMTHKECGNRFQQTPHNHLMGQGCPKCCFKNRKNNYSFIEKAIERFGDRYTFPNIDKEYNGSHSKITIKCNLCGNIFTKIACDFITSAYGGCACEKQREKLISYEELKKAYAKKEIIPFEGLKNKFTDKVELVCDKHGLYKKYIRDLFNNNDNCQICSKSYCGTLKRLNIEEYDRKLKEKHPSIKIVDRNEFINTSEKIRFKCDICGHVFKRTPGLFIYNNLMYSCPECGKKETIKKVTKTQSQFESDVEGLYGDLYTVIGEYISSDKKIKIKCNDCGRCFNIEANSFLQGHGCPYHKINYSVNENKIYEYVKTLQPNVIQHDRTILNGNELDIYVPDKKIAIEYNGLYWHSELQKKNDYHLLKTEECEKQGVRLIHIFEDEWLHKAKICKSMLSNMFGISKNKIDAKKCTVKETDKKEATDFLNDNHINGWCPSQIKLGLYYENRLVSLMTFRKSKQFSNNNQTKYDLLRFCNKIDTDVINGESELFEYFIKNYSPASVISYADRRWSNDDLYQKLGFKHLRNSKPNYYYIIGTIRKNSLNFRKSILIKKYNCPVEMTEKEFCHSQKWYRIYDCGTKLYEWKDNQPSTN